MCHNERPRTSFGNAIAWGVFCGLCVAASLGCNTRETDSKPPARSKDQAKSTIQRIEEEYRQRKREEQRHIVPRDKVAFRLPSAEQQTPDPAVLESFRELSSRHPKSPLPAEPGAYTAKQFIAQQRQWYRAKYAEGYQKFGTRNPDWDASAVKFVKRAIDAIIDRRRRKSGYQGQEPVDENRELVAQAKSLVDAGCTDPLVLALYAELLAHIQDFSQARQFLQRAVKGFQNSDYPFEVATHATLHGSQYWITFKQRLANNWRAGDEIIHLLNHRTYSRIERRIFFGQFDHILDGFLRQQPAQFAIALSQQQESDPWLTKMLLGRFHVRMATDLSFCGTQTNTRRLTHGVFQAHARTAWALLLEAWKLQPDSPEAAVELLKLSNRQPRFWFDQAVAAQFDYAPAYAAMRQTLVKQADGRYDRLLEFGKECLATKRFDTRVPGEFYLAALPTVLQVSRREVAADPGMFDDFRTLCEGYAAATDDELEIARRKSTLLGVAFLYGRNDAADQLLAELDGEVDTAALTAVSVRLGDVRRTLMRKQRPFGHRESIVGLAFLDHGKTLLTAVADRSMRLWDVGTGKQSRALSDLTSTIATMAISPDRKLVATVGADKTVVVLETAVGNVCRKLDLQAPIRALAWAHDNDTLAIATEGSESNHVALWQVSSGKESAVLAGHAGHVRALAFSPLGNLLASTAGHEATPGHGTPDMETHPYEVEPNEVVVWDLATDRAVIRLKPFAPVVHSLRFSPDGRWLAMAGQDWRAIEKPQQHPTLEKDDVARIVETATWKRVQTMRGHRDLITALAFADDGDVLITGSADRSIRSWDIVTGKEIAVFAGHNNSITSLARSPETQRLATSDADGEVRIWDTTRSNLRSRVQGNLLDQRFERILQLKTAAGGRLVATCDQFTGVALWTAATRFSTADSFRGDPTLFTNAFDISPDGLTVATVGGTSSPVQRAADQDRGEVLLWEIASGRVTKRLSGHRGSVMCARFSPDGKSLATGSCDTSVIVWNVETGRPWKWGTLKEHFGTVTTLAFSADGTMLATGARGGELLGKRQDGNFKVWDLPDNPQAPEKPLVSRVTREGFGPPGVEQIAFSPDGKSLLASSCDTVGLWDTAMFKQRFSVPGRFFDVAPDGGLFCSGGGKDLLREARLWETASGKEVRRLVGGHVASVSAVAFKGDQRVITGSYGGRVAYWDTESGKELLNFND